MAVIPTGAIYKALSFDGESSRNYGVYITGEAVYNAPVRDVEMIAIPGRNGTFALDNGRFENIEVTYPAGIFADNETDFAAAISDFRNFLASRSGYCRLEDDYNPNEYRMAVYKSGLSVDPAKLEAGEFDITFDCKPQRWLTSGEEAITITSGTELTNPTLFESGPLLAIKGYGTILFNDYEVVLENAQLGPVLIKEGESRDETGLDTTTITMGLPRINQFLNAGDTITLEGLVLRFIFKIYDEEASSTVISSNSGISGSSASCTSGPEPTVSISLPDLDFATGTESSYQNVTVISGKRLPGNETFSLQVTITVSLVSNNRLRLRYVIDFPEPAFASKTITLTYGDIMGDSSNPFLGDPTYIDCDLGDAYKIENDEYISLNRNVDLGSDLPVLAPGSNTITFDNTVTELKITPRWWKV